MSNIMLIVGLGNPGPKYRYNRHNIGFQVVDLFASRHGIDLSRVQHRAVTGDGWVTTAGTRNKVLIAKPLTFMNASGEPVANLANYYKIDAGNIFVIHDDLDLESATIRLRPGGSSGGQNGIKSIIQRLGTQDFNRMRIGIGRPPGRMDPADYVLHDFSAKDEEAFGPLRETACDAIECWLSDGIDAAMNRYNG